MPELPEVEITARRLDAALRGAAIESAVAPGINALKSFAPPLDALAGLEIDRDRLRAQHDYELDVKAEEELKALMNHLMHQDEILLQIINRLDRGDREMKRLARLLEAAQEPRTEAPAPKGPERQLGIPAP